MMTTMTMVALKASAILASAAAASLLLGRASASLRHLLWTAALVAVLALPALQASDLRVEVAVPGWLAPVVGNPPRSTPAVAEPVVFEAVVFEAATAAPVSPRRSAVRAAVPQTPGVSARGTASGSSSSVKRAKPLAATSAASEVPRRAGLPLGGVLAAAWLLGFLLLLVSALVGHLEAHRLVTRDVRPAPDSLRRRLAALMAEMGIRTPVRLVVSYSVRVPATWGLRSATIVLPAHHDAWGPATADRVLLHELAHVARRDCLTRLIGEVSRALHWPNPFAWLAVSRQRVESERACDDHVLARGDRPSAYAEDLVALARRLGRDRLPSAALAMAGRSAVPDRVRAILDPLRTRRSVGRLGAAAAMIAALAAAFSLTGLVPVAAQQPSDPLRELAPPPAVPRPETPVAPPVEPTWREALASLAGDLVERPFGHPVPPEEPAPPATRTALFVFPRLAAQDQDQELCVFREGGRRSTSSDIDDDRVRIRWETDGCRVAIEIDGEVEFAADDSGISRMARGARFEIEERIGRTSRRAILEEQSGSVERRFWVDGDARPWDAEADGWIAQILPELFRHTTINAEARVRRMLAEGGPDRVFEEVELMRSDHVSTHYLGLLIELGDLDDADYVRIMDYAADHVESDHNATELLLTVVAKVGLRPAFQAPMLRAAEGIESDHQKGRVLGALLDSDLSGDQVDAVLRSARTIESDHNLSEILSRLARRDDLSTAGRASFMQTLETVESDHQHAMVLAAFLDARRLTDAELTRVLEMTSGIESDHELATVLQRVAAEYDLSGDQVTAYLRAASRLESDHETAMTATSIADRADFTGEQLGLVLDLVRGIDSDHQRMAVLDVVIARRDLTSDEIEEVLDVASQIDSDHQLSMVLTRLIEDEELDDTNVLGVIETASLIDSEHNQGSVLVAVAQRYELDGRALTLYERLAADMGQHQRGVVLAALRRRVR